MRTVRRTDESGLQHFPEARSPLLLFKRLRPLLPFPSRIDLRDSLRLRVCTCVHVCICVCACVYGVLASCPLGSQDLKVLYRQTDSPVSSFKVGKGQSVHPLMGKPSHAGSLRGHEARRAVTERRFSDGELFSWLPGRS